MRKVCVAVTARPSYSRVKSVLQALAKRSDVELQIIVAASALVLRFGRVVDVMRADGLGPIAEVSCYVDGDSTLDNALTTGLLLTQLAGLLDHLRPDIVVTIADRHETLATAMAASYQHIPLCHVQGGEMSGSIDDKVRNAVTQLADTHCVATAAAARRVFSMLPNASVHLTGCPSIDIAAEAKRLGPLPGHDVVVLQHPVSDEVEHAADQMRETIEALEGLDVLWIWPGAAAGNAASAKALRMAGLAVPGAEPHPRRNLPPVDFLRTLLGSGCLVGNSSVGIRECSFLGVPVVNIGTRQRGREQGPNVIEVPYRAQAIREAVYGWKGTIPPSSSLYGDGTAGERIAGILAGE